MVHSAEVGGYLRPARLRTGHLPHRSYDGLTGEYDGRRALLWGVADQVHLTACEFDGLVEHELGWEAPLHAGWSNSFDAKNRSGWQPLRRG